MFSSCKLRLVQPYSGKRPDEDFINEKSLIIRLSRVDYSTKSPLGNEYVKNLPMKSIFEWIGQGLTWWGFYSIVGNHTGNNADPSFYIGAHEPKKAPKIWRFNPSELRFYFGTVNTNMGGGGLEFGETTDMVKDDLYLNNANPNGSRVTPQSGENYGTGKVLVPSWIAPFRTGDIYWETA